LRLLSGVLLAPFSKRIDVVPLKAGGGLVAPVEIIGLLGGVGVAIGGIEEGVARLLLEFLVGCDEAIELGSVLRIVGEVVPFLRVVFQIVERVFGWVFPEFIDGFDFRWQGRTFVVGESGGHGDDVVGIKVAGRDVVDMALSGRPDEFPRADTEGFLNEAVLGKLA